MKFPIKILVTGGRSYGTKISEYGSVVTDWEAVGLLEKALDEFLEGRNPTDVVLIHGAAKGADTLADAWGRKRRVNVVACPADWETYGLSAGIKRNVNMLQIYKPHVVVAFPGGAGTAHMVSIAQKAGVRVIFPSEEKDDIISKMS